MFCESICLFIGGIFETGAATREKGINEIKKHLSTVYSH